MQGIHIIGDLHNCDLDGVLVCQDQVNNFSGNISNRIGLAGFHQVGVNYHFFKKDAFTGVHLLAESHISMHTWPEYRYVSIDIYTCNKIDNEKRANEIFEYLAGDVFKSKQISKKIINRN